jgi:hypothetical protein
MFIGPLTEFDTCVNNILHAYVMADDSDIADGIEWYARALRLATELDPGNVRKAVGIIAVLSPMTSWPQNVKKARAVYAGGMAWGLGDSVSKAARIFNGEDVDSVVSGPKVTSFFHNILGDDARVTIDRHAIDCAYGRVLSDSQRANVVKTTKARDGYGILRSAYLHVAGIISEETGMTITGAQMQAIVWTYWRRNVIANNHGDNMAA